MPRYSLTLSALALSLFVLGAAGAVVPRVVTANGQISGGTCPPGAAGCCGGCDFDPQGNQTAFACSLAGDVSIFCAAGANSAILF